MHEEIEPAHREVRDLESSRPDHTQTRARRIERRKSRILLLRLAKAETGHGERIRKTRDLRYLDRQSISRRAGPFRRHERLARSRGMDRCRARFAAFHVA